MKKTLILLFILIASYLEAQVSFSCNYRQDCTWNTANESFDICEGGPEYSLFTFNDLETVIVHTTPLGESAYFILNKYAKEEKKLYFYNLVSDTGNNYLLVLDPKHTEIRVLHKIDKEFYLTKFTIKSGF